MIRSLHLGVRLVFYVLVCTIIAACSCSSTNTQNLPSPSGFGVGKWKGHEVSQWDPNWSYTYELTIYNDGTAECQITNHGPAGDKIEYGYGSWYKESESFADRQYNWTHVKIKAGRMEHSFYVDNAGNVYLPYGREIWQAMRESKPAYTFRRIH